MSETIGKRIIRLREVGSTNTYLKDNSELLKQHGLVVIAEMQTSGRGRAGRKFVSLPQKNVTFSVVLHPLSAWGSSDICFTGRNRSRSCSRKIYRRSPP